MKLNIGDIIEVIGWVMMKKLESGEKYRVNKVYKYSGKDVYSFTKPKGKKEIVNHYVSDVDLWIGTENNNRIDIIRR